MHCDCARVCEPKATYVRTYVHMYNSLIKVPLHNLTEDLPHGGVVKLIHCNGVEVPEEARCDRVPSSSGRAHGGHELSVHQLHGRVLLEVIPVPMVQPLSQQLDRGLRSVHLSCRHVEVIHKHNLWRGNDMRMCVNSTYNDLTMRMCMYMYYLVRMCVCMQFK